MTDNEIIKALECCSKDDCYTCPFCEVEHCVTMWDALDLIKRQKAEIENYKQIAEYQQSVSMDRWFKIKRLEEEIELLRKRVEYFEDREADLEANDYA